MVDKSGGCGGGGRCVFTRVKFVADAFLLAYTYTWDVQIPLTSVCKY